MVTVSIFAAVALRRHLDPQTFAEAIVGGYLDDMSFNGYDRKLMSVGHCRYVRITHNGNRLCVEKFVAPIAAKVYQLAPDSGSLLSVIRVFKRTNCQRELWRTVQQLTKANLSSAKMQVSRINAAS